MSFLRESMSFDHANMLIEADDKSGTKKLYMKGIFIEGDVKNANQRIYPASEIKHAVETISEQIKGGYSVLGEVDHPENMTINIDRVSHKINEMWMEGSKGYGKLEIIPTPMGQMIKTLLESGVKLGVSSRGTGDVDPYTNKVSNFEIITVDIVAQPSAPSAYPKALYESLMNRKHGHRSLEIAAAAQADPTVQKYLKSEVLRIIKELKLK